MVPLEGRHLRWVVTRENTGAQHCTLAMIRVAPHSRARPAHSHPEGEEIIYILNGHGRVLIDGEVESVKAGCAVLFPKGKVHMLENLSGEEMKVACFFRAACGVRELTRCSKMSIFRNMGSNQQAIKKINP